MALKFLNKKGWHTGSLRNIENVWKAEQKHEAEQRKLEELRKQILEERERDEFRQLQEQAGITPRQERLEFLYDSGLAVGKTSSDGFKAIETYPGSDASGSASIPAPTPTQEPASGSAPSSSSNQAAVPGALFEEKPQSANDAWRKLHTDPLLMIRQREQEALARIKNNPVKMAMIRKSVESKKKQHDTSNDKEHKKVKSKRKKHSSSKRHSDSESDSHEGRERRRKTKHRKEHHSDSDSDREDGERKTKVKKKKKERYSYSESDSDREKERTWKSTNKNEHRDFNEDSRERTTHHRHSHRDHEKSKYEEYRSDHRGDYKGSDGHDDSKKNGPPSKYDYEKSKYEEHRSDRRVDDKRSDGHDDSKKNCSPPKRDYEKSKYKEHRSDHRGDDKRSDGHDDSKKTGLPPKHESFKRRGRAPQLTEEERAAKLREMQMDAEVHEDQRWKRLKKADEDDAQEERQGGNSRGKSFLHSVQKSVYGAEKGGSSTIEESVRRRTHFLQGRTADERNAFRR